jgi:ABC-2 type transport system ATP-binding protein
VGVDTGASGIAVRGLTKRFGRVVAVNDLSFDVLPGRVTGFLGPNGAGKTTTLRMLLGLVVPTSGTALVDGAPYRALRDPARRVGAVLEASGFHPARSARNALRVVAAAGAIPRSRVDEVLTMVGLGDDAGRSVGGFSLGMRQRLELARALLGDPDVLVLDEPANGLDPQGIAWLRGFLRWYAAQGRIVLISSHLLAEAEQTLDDVIVLSAGRLAAQGPVSTLAQMMGRPPEVRVRTPEPDRLLQVLAGAGISAHLAPDGARAHLAPDGALAHRAPEGTGVHQAPEGTGVHQAPQGTGVHQAPEGTGVHQAPEGTVVALAVRPEQVGPVMATAQIVVYDMRSSEGTLEEVFFALTAGDQGIAPMGSSGRP